MIGILGDRSVLENAAIRKLGTRLIYHRGEFAIYTLIITTIPPEIVGEWSCTEREGFQCLDLAVDACFVWRLFLVLELYGVF